MAVSDGDAGQVEVESLAGGQSAVEHGSRGNRDLMPTGGVVPGRMMWRHSPQHSVDGCNCDRMLTELREGVGIPGIGRNCCRGAGGCAGGGKT